MSTKTPAASVDIIREGWEILVQQLGIDQATRFVVALERGEGDSILEIDTFWGDASVGDIHKRIRDAKTRGELKL